MAFEKELCDISDFPNWTGIEPLRSVSGYDEKAEIGDFLERTEKITEGVIRIKILPPATMQEREKIFLITRKDGRRLLLRTSPISEYENMRARAIFANRLIREGLVLTMPPIEVAACGNETLCYSLFGFIETTNGTEYLRTLPIPEQYDFGTKCGRMLRNIHGIKPDPGSCVKSGSDVSLSLERIDASNTEFKGLREMRSFLSDTAKLKEDRPIVSLHGNFVPSEIFSYGELQGVYTPLFPACGDPYSDFGAISPMAGYPFARGLISGYFKSGVPNGFFDLLAIYSAEKALERISNASSPQEKLWAIRIAERIAVDFDMFETTLPRWYH